MAAREEFQIVRAERKQARLRLAVCAASNGGKTWTSLELAFGLVEQLIALGVLEGRVEGKIGVIDTERKSAQLYAHLGPYDTIDLGPPHSVERYVGALQALERAGCAVIILDSISHAWQGAGGVLSLLDRFETHERFSAFGKVVNKAQDELVDAMLRSPCHIIATMRSKTAWVLEDKENRQGRTVKTPRRIGLAPIQRPGIEFEFTTLLDLDTDTHHARVVKNRCPLFEDWQPKKITREHGRLLADWLMEGAPEPKEPISGTATDRAIATADAAKRACARVQTLPDLARVFDTAITDLKAFQGSVDKEELLALRDEVIAAKDIRKAELGSPPPVACITPDDAIDLEDMCTTGKVAIDRILDTFRVKRLGLLPAANLAEAVQQIQDESLEHLEEPVAIPARLYKRLNPEPDPARRVPAGAGAFDDMEDDLPWLPGNSQA